MHFYSASLATPVLLRDFDLLQGEVAFQAILEGCFERCKRTHKAGGTGVPADSDEGVRVPELLSELAPYVSSMKLSDLERAKLGDWVRSAPLWDVPKCGLVLLYLLHLLSAESMDRDHTDARSCLAPLLD